MSIEKLTKRLQGSIDFALANEEDLNALSWNYQEGILITVNEAKLLIDIIQLLKDYEQWEADIINEDKLWWPNSAKDVMRGHIYDTMLKLQEKRNNLLRELK